MCLRKRGTTWSGDLLRHELVYSGIRRCRTRVDGTACPAAQPDDANDAPVPPAGAAPEERAALNG